MKVGLKFDKPANDDYIMSMDRIKETYLERLGKLTEYSIKFVPSNNRWVYRIDYESEAAIKLKVHKPIWIPKSQILILEVQTAEQAGSDDGKPVIIAEIPQWLRISKKI